MAPSLGYFTLWLALCFSILQFFTSFIKDTSYQTQFNKITVIGLLLSTLFSFFSLMYCHVVSDFSLKQDIFHYKAMPENLETRYIRVNGMNLNTCPDYHPGAGGPSWVFTDEIVIN